MISLNNEPCCVCGGTRACSCRRRPTPSTAIPAASASQCGKCGLLFNSPRLETRAGRAVRPATTTSSIAPTPSSCLASRRCTRGGSRWCRSLVRNEGTNAARLGRQRRGYFPAVLKQLGWDCARRGDLTRRFGRTPARTVWLDTSSPARSSIRIRSESHTFPLVTAIDVIEHVPCPPAFVAGDRESR